MTLVVKNSTPRPSLTVAHNPDGSIQLYVGEGIKLEPFDAVRLANYILESQPDPEEDDTNG